MWEMCITENVTVLSNCSESLAFLHLCFTDNWCSLFLPQLIFIITDSRYTEISLFENKRKSNVFHATFMSFLCIHHITAASPAFPPCTLVVFSELVLSTPCSECNMTDYTLKSRSFHWSLLLLLPNHLQIMKNTHTLINFIHKRSI